MRGAFTVYSFNYRSLTLRGFLRQKNNLKSQEILLMAKFGVWSNGYIQINGVDLSNSCESFEPTQSRPSLDFHSHGDDFQLKTAGLIDAGLTARFFTDFAAGGNVQTLQPLMSGNTIFPIIYRPVNAAKSVNNPEWSGNYQIGRFDAIKGRHGEVLMTECTFMPVTKIVFATS
jgi:hypothetical protein